MPMHFIQYYIGTRRGFRRALKLINQLRLRPYKKREESKRQESALNLMNYGKKRYSQNSEDGIIEEIFRRVGTTNRFFVEFGVEDGTENNTRFLLEKRAGRASG